MFSFDLAIYLYAHEKRNETNFSYTTWFRIVKHAKIDNQYVYLTILTTLDSLIEITSS